ncbi:glutamate--tRNA ligase [Helicovermis profundi]|uniref:Glutamate--tRNA ligase n=1 Tax=Helicovermis profundi TaxID=3065157 RepID=A0AAU9E609_9FIRM|nr:glutamate--tRNA ligase [Clostridia bacterium S502]
MSVRVRFAPSPTGWVHIGGLRTALYNYLFAKKNEGTYLLRIEDTDRTRYVEGAIENMIEAMKWAGVMHTEGPFIENGKIVQKGGYGPYIQSERLDMYNEYVNKLIDENKAYYCFCSKERLDEVRADQKQKGLTPKYDGHCRDLSKEDALKRIENGEEYVVRLKLPENTDISFEDAVRGKVTFNTNDVDDQVLIKTDGFPTYHLAVIVDDHFMGITHVIRGEEWLSSTPKHVYLYEAFGWDVPTYVHLPNILNSDKKKLSKRQGDVAVRDFEKKGYLPEALINYIALLGWSPEDNKEIMTVDEMAESFSFERVSKSGSVFDVNKLNWVNSHYIKEKDLDELSELSTPFFIEQGIIKEKDVNDKKEWIKLVVDLSREYINMLSEIPEFSKRFSGEAVQIENDDAREMIELEHVYDMLQVFKTKVNETDEINEEFAKKVMKMVQKETGIKGKNLFMPTRVALSGQSHGPDLVKSLIVMGKELVIKRIDYTLENYCKK